MNDRDQFSSNSPEGCGFLSPVELELAISGTLDDERRADFDRHLDQGCADCLLLDADLEIFAGAVRDGLREQEASEFAARAPMLLARLSREAARRTKPPSAGSVSRSWRWAAAAALILVAVSVGLLQFTDRRDAGLAIGLPGGGEIVASPMPFSPPPVLRGGTTAGELWEEAGRAYDSSSFAEAAEILDRIDDSDSTASDAALYRGISLLMAGDAAGARDALFLARSFAEQQELPTASIDWYGGLAALSAGDLPAARESLERANAAGGLYGERAAELLARAF